VGLDRFYNRDGVYNMGDAVNTRIMVAFRGKTIDMLNNRAYGIYSGKVGTLRTRHASKLQYFGSSTWWWGTFYYPQETSAVWQDFMPTTPMGAVIKVGDALPAAVSHIDPAGYGAIAVNNPVQGPGDIPIYVFYDANMAKDDVLYYFRHGPCINSVWFNNQRPYVGKPEYQHEYVYLSNYCISGGACLFLDNEEYSIVHSCVSTDGWSGHMCFSSISGRTYTNYVSESVSLCEIFHAIYAAPDMNKWLYEAIVTDKKCLENYISTDALGQYVSQNMPFYERRQLGPPVFRLVVPRIRAITNFASPQADYTVKRHSRPYGYAHPGRAVFVAIYEIPKPIKGIAVLHQSGHRTYVFARPFEDYKTLDAFASVVYAHIFNDGMWKLIGSASPRDGHIRLVEKTIETDYGTFVGRWFEDYFIMHQMPYRVDGGTFIAVKVESPGRQYVIDKTVWDYCGGFATENVETRFCGGGRCVDVVCIGGYTGECRPIATCSSLEQAQNILTNFTFPKVFNFEVLLYDDGWYYAPNVWGSVRIQFDVMDEDYYYRNYSIGFGPGMYIFVPPRIIDYSRRVYLERRVEFVEKTKGSVPSIAVPEPYRYLISPTPP